VRRTRKWSFVAQEAARLAGLGLSPLEIAKRLDVNKSTVTRWMAAGKLTKVARTSPPKPGRRQKPVEWAAAVRKGYDLDATDEQLVTLAADALEMSKKATVPPQVRLAAAGRFQALVRQLALVARRADKVPTDAPAPAAVAAESKKHPPVKRPAGDPRRFLTAVK